MKINGKIAKIWQHFRKFIPKFGWLKMHKTAWTAEFLWRVLHFFLILNGNFPRGQLDRCTHHMSHDAGWPLSKNLFNACIIKVLLRTVVDTIHSTVSKFYF